MKKLTLLTVALFSIILLNAQTAVQPAGSGTTTDPYQIATLDNLYWLSLSDTAWDKHFVQTADINAADTRNWNISGTDTLGFSPIGTGATKFQGTYNGQSHIIDSLYINRPDESSIGLFGMTLSASIEYLAVTNATIYGDNQVGVLVGYNWNYSQINNCFTTGVVSGNLDVGGFTGKIDRYCTVSNSYTKANVNGGDYYGGFTGENMNNSSIENCYSTGYVLDGSSYYIGGFCGNKDYNAPITNCFWDKTTSGQTSSFGGTGKYTYEMRNITTYTNSNWDFVNETANGTDDYWNIHSCLNDGYPYLDWQNLFFEAPAGSGTETDPYQIATLEDLRWLSEHPCVWDRYFIQTADINAADTRNWNIEGTDTLGFSPIGNSIDGSFYGFYNGQGHIIDSLFINRDQQHIGLFGNAIEPDSRIENLGVTNAYVNAHTNTRTGIIAGSFRGIMSQCFATGTVIGNGYTGGLVGGTNSSVQIINCYSNCDVTVNDQFGALFVGSLYGHIENCYTDGHIDGSASYKGGIVGYFNNSTASVSNSFYNVETIATSAGGTGITTAQMQDITTYTDSTWDFVGETANGTEDIWNISACSNNGYPYLSWQTTPVDYPEGSGTETDPYQIATLCDLKWLSETDSVWDKHFIQVADINAADTRNWNNGNGFSPIGNYSTYFEGSYDGQGHIIDSLYINKTTSYTAFIGYLWNGRIANLGVTNAEISGGQYSAVLIGYMSIGSICENNFSTGSVSANNYNCGGLVGYGYNCSVSNSYSFASVSGINYVAGLISQLENTTIENCYSTGEVSGNSYLGGLIADKDNNTTVTNSFWNTETSAQTASAGGTGLTTAQMQEMCIYADSTWDFMIETVNGSEDIWGMNDTVNNGYPFLAWQGYQHNKECCGYIDTENPVVEAQDISIQLNENNQASITESDVVVSASDNCEIADTTLSQYDFTDANIGANIVIVTLSDAQGNTTTDTITVTVDPYTSVNTFIDNNNINIYPNPADNVLNIESGNVKINNIEIFDITGKQIIKTCNKTQIDVSNLKQGMYYIKINSNNNSIIKQFVKISR